MDEKYTLSDFHKLAYEFAIRNPRVIELLHMEITDDVVEELGTYGIDATYKFQGNIENGLEELFLEYKHLKDVNHEPFSEDNGGEDVEFYGYKYLVHPLNNSPYHDKEPDIDALNRISVLIQTKGGKLNKLISGEAFEDYDACILDNSSIYARDPSTNRKKTIKSNIEFIKEWIKPENYLQLIHKYKIVFT